MTKTNSLQFLLLGYIYFCHCSGFRNFNQKTGVFSELLVSMEHIQFIIIIIESFERQKFLLEFKEGENFNHRHTYFED